MNNINKANRLLFEELVTRIQTQSQAAGIAVAIVNDKGETQYENYFGFRDVEKAQPVDSDTIFGLASVTKSFVALSVMQLHERGIVDLEAPASKYLPEFTNRNQEPVKIWHFLCHSGGFYPVKRTRIRDVAKDIGLSEEICGDLGLCEELALAGTKVVAEQLDAQVKGKGIIGRPGEYMSYCNDGFGLLSEIVRRRGGEKSFGGYVKRNVLDPLGMSRSGCEYLAPGFDDNRALLYQERDGRMSACRDCYDNAFVLAGAGAMKSTVSDMKRYLGMFLKRGKGPDGTRILSMEGIRAMVRPRIEYRPGSYYCYGLSTKMLDDVNVVEHGGSLTGVSSHLSWSYDAGAGVVVLCNTSDVPVSVIADGAMRMYHGRAPLEPRDLYRECPWSADTKKSVCGVYRSGEGQELELYEEEKEGDIQARVNGKKVSFVTVQEDLGLIREMNKDACVKLFRDEEGAVFAVGYGGRMLPRCREGSRSQ